MSVHAIHLNDTKQLLVDLYRAKHPSLLCKVEESLRLLNAHGEEARGNLQVLGRLSRGQPKSLELVARCAGYIASCAVARTFVLERRELAETLEGILRNLHAFAVTLHSLAHMEEDKGPQWRGAYQAVQLIARKMQDECAVAARRVKKNLQTFAYFEKVLHGFEAKLTQLRGDFAHFEAQSEGYAAAVAAIGLRGSSHKRLEGFKVAADRFRQLEVLGAQIELLLEQPRLYAFEFFRSEASFAEGGAAGPGGFESVVSCLNNANFVQSYMLRFPLPELVQAFRQLFETMDIAELQREFRPFVYHEESFIEHYQRYAQLQRAAAEGEYPEAAGLLRDIKDYGFESRSARDFSEKIFEATLRSLKHEGLLADFDRFRDELQAFCLREFGALVLVHA